jgi:hypothetical protein
MSDTTVWDVLKSVLSQWWFWLILVLVLVGSGVVDGSRMAALVDKAIEVIKAAR